MSGFQFSLFSLMLAASVGTPILAHSPVDFLEVLSVVPARPIQHAVDLKGSFDSERVTTALEGPQFFSRSVGCLDRPAKKKPAFLNWFKIVNPPKEPERKVSILDMVRGGSSKPLSIQGAEYLLSPAQLVTTGVPAPVPFGLDIYKAYRIVDAPSLDRQLVFTGSIGPDERKLGRPLFVCLPVSQWHHEEHVSITHPGDCFVVYNLDEQAHQQKLSTMDQFGLNELVTTKNHWLCVRAAFLNTVSE